MTILLIRMESAQVPGFIRLSLNGNSPFPLSLGG